MVPEFTAEDLAQLQAEDSVIGAAYRDLHEGLDPSPDELRGFPLESRALLSLRPEVRMEGDVISQGSARDHPSSGPYSSEVQAVPDQSINQSIKNLKTRHM